MKAGSDLASGFHFDDDKMLSPLSQSSPRPIVLFHIPKTGGSSIRVTFRTLFGRKSVTDVTEAHDLHSLAASLAKRARAATPSLIQGHIPPYALETPHGFIRTTLVRDPIETLLSNFCYVYKTRYQSPEGLAFLRSCPGYKHGRFSARDLKRWVGHCAQDDYQTRFLSGHRSGELDAPAIAKAQEALERCELVGTTQDMSGYLVALARIAGLEIRQAIHANPSPRDILEDDAATLRDRLRDHFHHDSMLYDRARARFARLAECLQIPQPPALATLPEKTGGKLVERVIAFALRSPSDQGRQIWRRTQDLIGTAHLSATT